MQFFQDLGLNQAVTTIDWELTPADTFGMFESWGGKERIRNKDERHYYFYIDYWQKLGRLCFMERGIKYARILAKIDAPHEMLERCVQQQGKSTPLDCSYAINDEIRKWLQENVLDRNNGARVIPLQDKQVGIPAESGLPLVNGRLPEIEKIQLRSEPCGLMEEQVEPLIRGKNIYDARHNPEGSSIKQLVDNGDGLTVTDRATGLMWHRGGSDINSIRTIQNWIKDLNENSFAGFSDWRLPTTLEGLTLVEKEKNDAGLHIHRCFSPAQPFIFTADQRQPGGHWFVDFTTGSVFWASAFNPGGFGRACRSVE